MFSNQTIGDRKIEEKMKMKMDKSDEHENEITCFDVLTKKGLYVTGDSEGIIKIWNCQKQLVRDIRFVDPINSVCFLILPLASSTSKTAFTVKYCAIYICFYLFKFN